MWLRAFGRRLILPLTFILSLTNLIATEVEDEKPSPNGAYIFRKTFEEDGRKVELVEKKTDKVLLLVAESEEDSNRLFFKAAWAKDSRRFAFTSGTSRLSASVSLYEKDGQTFRSVELPEQGEVKFPEKYAEDERFPHWLCIDWWSVVAWRKDGSLVIRGESAADGNGGVATATHTVTLAPDKNGVWKIRNQQKKFAITKQ